VLGETKEPKMNQQGQPLFSLRDRVKVAERIGRIDNATRRLAEEVVFQGNRAVHRSATPAADSLNIVADTLKVIDVLNGKANP